MERLIGGGRKKADDRWKHVTKLREEKNQTEVRCKYCGFKFKTAGSSRIESHIFGPKEGQKKEIQMCKVFPRLKKEKEDLLDSQGLSTLDRPRDYNKPNETLMLNGYMSPKTMWEGIKALQQTQIYPERFQVGPFSVSHMVSEPHMRLIQYVFEKSCSDEAIFSSPRLHLKQSDFTTLRPEAYLDSWVIDIFVYILTQTERKKSKPLNLYLPVMLSKEALNSDVSSFLNFVERHNMRENYMFHLNYCEKIFIPVHVEKNSCGHFYLYIIDVKNQVVEIWDSLCHQLIDKTKREHTTKLLFAMESILGNVKFTEFPWGMACNIPSQPNRYDCGIFVIKYMQQSDNFVRQNPSFQFDSDKERLDLALELLNSDFNQEREILYDRASGSYAQVQCEEGLDSCGIKRKRVDACESIFENVGSVVYMELDDFTDTVKRKNVSLKTEYQDDNSPAPRDGMDPVTRLCGKETLQDELNENHALVEQCPCEKLNERFLTLKSFLPTVSKMDRASVLDDTIKHVKQLRKENQDLEARNRQLELLDIFSNLPGWSEDDWDYKRDTNNDRKVPN